MLNKTLEFLRIVDMQPNDEKVRKRTDAAKELTGLLLTEGNRELLLFCIQGVVTGFDPPLFKQDSPAIVQVYKSIKDRDATLPFDLKENAMELRAVAGIAIGELLSNEETRNSHNAVLTALSIHAALSYRPASNNKYVQWMHETLHKASTRVLGATADSRRLRTTDALDELEGFEKSAEGTDPWDDIMPAVTAAIKEARDQEAINREELNTLWWMFAAYSEIEDKPLVDLDVVTAAFSAGIELAKMALLPPSKAAAAMIRRAVESGRKGEQLEPIKLQDVASSWSQAMAVEFSTDVVPVQTLSETYPVLLPLLTTCMRLRADRTSARAAKECKAVTGIAVTHQLTPVELGAQAFWEKALQRLLNGEA